MTYYSVSYFNNLGPIPAEVIAGDVTPAQYVRNHNITLGNYTLQMNGIPLSSADHNRSFQELAGQYGISENTEIILSGVKPSNGGC